MEMKTPLYDRHTALGARMVPFAGWLMPERYALGVIGEHMAVRSAAGMFDVSHMGEVFISGPGALDSLQRLFTNDFTKMRDGQIRYTVMCNDAGGILDDMLVCRVRQDRYLVVVNACNRQADVEWMQEHLGEGAVLEDVSDQTAQIAVQGPAAAALVAGLADSASRGRLPSARYTFAEDISIAGTPCLVSRTGYTGEDGFELYCEPGRVGALWDALLGRGAVPCGLGARDTLRLEAAMPLYGHEMDQSITPLETGLSFAVKLKKGDFIGKNALLAAGPPARARVGVKVTGRGIARENYDIYLDGAHIGKTTSGTHCPYLGYAAAMALVKAGTPEGTAVTVDIRGRTTEAVIAPLPLYTRSSQGRQGA
ncbi:MAG: glycine cleavage system aminomethyltransferase GcvT [Oscillospiraceae bacterium]|nr:glycine cleavage system aminomethyltransferase GcvT [Oscillospiraceae bacterium]